MRELRGGGEEGKTLNSSLSRPTLASGSRRYTTYAFALETWRKPTGPRDQSPPPPRKKPIISSTHTHDDDGGRSAGNANGSVSVRSNGGNGSSRGGWQRPPQQAVGFLLRRARGRCGLDRNEIGVHTRSQL